MASLTTTHAAGTPGGPSSNRMNWVVVVAAAIGMIFSQGTLITFSFGVFIGPLTHEFGWSQTQASGGVTASQFALALSAPVWGFLVDRYGPRAVLMPSIVMLSLLIASLSLLGPNLWQLYVVLAAVSLLAGGASPLGYSAMLIRRFEANLGFALGIALTGVGLGAAILPPLATRLLTDFGWREAYLALGALTLLVTIPAALIATQGLSGPRRVRDHGQARLTDMLSSRTYILICLVFVLFGVISVGTLVHFVRILRSHGFSPPEAGQVAGIVGLAVIVARAGTGWVLDRMHAPFVVAAVALLASAGFLLMAYGTGETTAYAAALLLGLTLGADVDFVSFLVRRYFGQAAFGRLYGFAFGLFLLGTGIGPLVMGRSVDLTGSYVPGLLVFAALGALAAVLSMLMPAYARPRAAANAAIGEAAIRDPA